MGYRWQTNEHPDLTYDLFIFKPEAACIVRVRQTRYRIDPDTIYEKLIPDDIREVRALPFPPWFPKEIWLRTQHERAWRRLRIHDLSVGEIESWGRMITRTRTPSRYYYPPSSPSLVIGGGGRTTVSHDPFSDGEVPGWIGVGEVPVEAVPILSTIFVLNCCFLKPVVLNGKKPCNLAAFL